MGTSIELTVGGISLDYSKNFMGNDWGYLFQEADLIRRRTSVYDYKYFDENPEEAEALATGEMTFVRPLSRVVPRLRVMGYSIDNARTEYEAVVADEAEMASELEREFNPLSFDEFCTLATRYPISILADAFISYDRDDQKKAQGRFAADAAEFARIPQNDNSDTYWSERSYLGAQVCILSPITMLLVFALNPENLDVEVEWQFGPIVDAGWVKREAFKAGARRGQGMLIATEGASDARILRRAIDLMRPDVSDFFRFIDGDERHHFWGTGNLVKFAEGLLRIDIQNRVLFLFDNDAEGVDAYRKLLNLKLPSNMRSMLLPDIEELRSFPALGPEGQSNCDINGRAAAIECYLDLNLNDYPPARVIWSNYKREIDAWHGALEFKESYAKRFMEEVRDQVPEGYDTTKLGKLLDALIDEVSRLDSGQRLRLRE